MIQMIHQSERGERAGRALVFDREPLVRERASQLLALEGFETCTVDSPALFSEVRRSLEFELYLVGFRSRTDAEDFVALGQPPEPLVLLVPSALVADAAHLLVAFPLARRVDRRLRDPGPLGGQRLPDRANETTGVRLEDAVRRMFGPFGMSERQLEVLARALLGEGTSAIARRLFISEFTVRNHLHAIYTQVGVSGRRELVGRFVRGLIDAEDSTPAEDRPGGEGRPDPSRTA